MKSISASIIVLSGAIIFSVGAGVTHGGTQTFTMFFGGAICVAGMLGWKLSGD